MNVSQNHERQSNKRYSLNGKMIFLGSFVEGSFNQNEITVAQLFIKGCDTSIKLCITSGVKIVIGMGTSFALETISFPFISCNKIDNFFIEP